MSNIKPFLRYLFKGSVSESKGFLDDLLSIKPRTLIYGSAIGFFISWFLGRYFWTIIFMVSFVAANIYKVWVGGEWKHELRKQYLEKAKKHSEEKEGQKAKDATKTDIEASDPSSSKEEGEK